jgi:hypothetical protein
MEESLFKKHIQAVQERSTTKEKIITIILEKTGIQIQQEELSLLKKQITLSTSSVKKTKLFQRGIKEIVESLGYTLKN